MNWLNTLLYSYGSDAPEEVYWALNNFITMLNIKHHSKLLPLVHPFYYDMDGITEEEAEKRISDLESFLKTLDLI